MSSFSKSSFRIALQGPMVRLLLVVPMILVARSSRSAIAISAKDVDAPDAPLTSRGLQKVGAYYLLETDAQLSQSLRATRKADQQLEEYGRKRRDINRDIESTIESQIQWRHEINDLDAKMQRTPKSDPRKYNALGASIRERQTKIDESAQYLEKRRADLAKLVSPVDHISLTIDLANKMEAAMKRYDALAADPDVTVALASINDASGSKVRLGPSPPFKTELPQAIRRRDVINAGALKLDLSYGGVARVNVTLNDGATIPMVLDSGAAVVTLTAKVARQAGINVVKGGPTVTLSIADGSRVQAAVVLASTVRVGKFVAHDVACVVLPENAKNADCLLGGTFLKNFVYQIDLAAGELRLSPVTATTVPATTDPSDDAGKTPPSSRPASTTQPDPATSDKDADSTFTLELSAEIDANDQIVVTADALEWKHGPRSKWPQGVAVNGVAWNPKANQTLPVDDALNALRHVDWFSARLVERTGRGSISIEPQADRLIIRIADKEHGANPYIAKIAFRLKPDAK